MYRITNTTRHEIIQIVSEGKGISIAPGQSVDIPYLTKAINRKIAANVLLSTDIVGTTSLLDDEPLDLINLRTVSPTGIDDTDNIVAAFIAGKGNLSLLAGNYFIRPMVLECQEKWRNDATDWIGPKIVCSNGIAYVYPVGSAPVTNTRVQVQSFTLGASGTAFRCDGHPFVTGDKCIIQMPSYLAPTTGNTSERLNGKTVFVSVIDANNVEIFNDLVAGVPTNAITNSTSWGSPPADMVNNPVYLRRYSDNAAVDYTGALLRVTGPLNTATGKYQSIMGTLFQNISFRAATSFAPFYARQGIAVAIEAVGQGTLGVNGNSSPSQGNRFINCEFSGWDAGVLLDDCTNNYFENVNFQNCNNALWKGHNVDITDFVQCRFGDDSYIAGQARQEVSIYAPLSFRPGAPALEAPSSASVENYSGCWFMSILGISLFRKILGNLGGSLGSAPSASSVVTVRNCYAEQVRRLIDVNVSFFIDGLQIGNFKMDGNLTNNQCVIDAYGSGMRPHVSLKGITCDGGSSTVPKNGWVYVGEQTGANERNIPTVTIDGCQIYGNILRNNNGRKLLLRDGVANVNDPLSGSGFYQFVGMLQVAGQKRAYKRPETTGAVTIELFDEGYQQVITGLTGNLTINNPSTDSGTSATFAADYNYGVAALYQLRMDTLEIIVTQGAGGHTVGFGSDFVVNAANANGAAALASQMARYEFKYGVNGKWNQISPAVVWA